MVYLIIATGMLVIEILVWWLTHETTHTEEEPLARVRTKLRTKVERRISLSNELGKGFIARDTTEHLLKWFRSRSFRDVIRNFVMRPGEIANTAWLTYIIFAQTFGSYQTCDCMGSIWGRKNGFIDFKTAADYKAHGIYIYWGTSTALSIFVMSAGLAYIVHEYCTQSHFSTESYDRAMQGLKLTRRFKKHTAIFRVIPDMGIKFGKLCFFKITGGKSRKGRRSLVWTADTQLYRLSNLNLGYHS